MNLVEILKDCPKGTKLYSLVHGEVEFEHIETYCRHQYVIIKLKGLLLERINFNGKLYNSYDGECVLFPSKDQRDWSKFTAPWYKKETGTIDSIEKQGEQITSQTNERAWLYLVSDVLTWKDGIGQYLDDPRVQELAKKLCSKYSQKLYNPSSTEKDEQKSTDKIEPKFKVGDKIVNVPKKYMGASGAQGTILKITEDKYIFTDGSYIHIDDQDNWELVIDKKEKFDPKTLQPFDKVLVRECDGDIWRCSIFSHIWKDNLPYVCNGICYKCCIPYNEDTKHLVGTTEEAPEYYRYWEN